MGKVARQQTKPTAAAQDPVHVKPAAKQLTYLAITSRPGDLILSGLYMYLAVSSVFALYAGCRGQGMKMLRSFDGVCDQAVKVKLEQLNIPLELHATWHADVFKTGSECGEFLKLVSVMVNILLALPLSFVMFFGAKKNNWKNLAVMHATVLLVVSAFQLEQGLAANLSSNIFQVAYTSMVVIPLLFLHRWWADNAFTTDAYACGFVGRLCSFLCTLLVFFGVLFVIVTTYEWSIVSHKDLKGFKPVTPLVQEQVQQFGKMVIDKVNELRK